MSATGSFSTNSILYRFGPFEADLAKGELRKFGLAIRLQRKPWQLLLALLGRPGEVLTRADLQELLWDSDVVVDFEAGLNVAVKKLRAALNDSSDDPKYIETVAGAGYRFIGKVERTDEITASEPRIEIASNEDFSAISQSMAIPLEGSGFRLGTRPVLMLAIITAAVILVLTRFTLMRIWSPQPSVRSKKMKLVVLPFQNLSGAVSQEYLADGITEELSEKLGNLAPAQLSVIGRTSAMAYKGSKRTITDIGKDLSVDYVVEGSMRRQGKKLRITAQLVEVGDQVHLWAEEYERNTQDLFEVEDEIASEIARQIGTSLVLKVHQTGSGHTPDSGAHDDYLIARYYGNKRTPGGGAKAEEYYRRAIIEDPHYAAAYAGLAECVDRSEALQAAHKAVELDPSSTEAYTALGWVELYDDWDFKAAAAALQTAIRLDPSYAPAYHVYSRLLQLSGDFQDAIQEEKQAIQLDPLAFIFRAALAQSLSAAGDNESAIAAINEIFKIDPQYPKAHETLGRIYLSMGKYREAISQFESSEQYGGGKSPEFVAYAYARMGNKGRALRVLSDMQNSPDYQEFGTAIVEIGLGNNQQAVDSLDKTCQEHADDSMLSLKTDRIFDPLRSDPRWTTLLDRISRGQCAKL